MAGVSMRQLQKTLRKASEVKRPLVAAPARTLARVENRRADLTAVCIVLPADDAAPCRIRMRTSVSEGDDQPAHIQERTTRPTRLGCVDAEAHRISPRRSSCR